MTEPERGFPLDTDFSSSSSTFLITHSQPSFSLTQKKTPVSFGNFEIAGRFWGCFFFLRVSSSVALSPNVRIHGNKGVMENTRHGDKQRLRVWREPWEKRKGEPVETVYKPDFPNHHQEATRAGHGGGDFFTSHHFAEAIRTGEPPYLDVYRGIDMSIAGIQAWRSVLADSAPMDVPDFRVESVRKKHAKDDWSPDPEQKKQGQPSSSLLGELEPSADAKIMFSASPDIQLSNKKDLNEKCRRNSENDGFENALAEYR